MNFKVVYKFSEHELSNDLWMSKRHLFEAFFGDFYNFIYSHGGEKDLLEKNINNKKEFLDFAADWYSDGQENCYGVGFAFHRFYLDVEEGGKIENQSQNTFIGYCYHNGKYLDFLNFLITFFAWWRNDEHCTCFDPYNHADDFFNSSWAALVDTAKLFYFTSETAYHWHSFRIKYAVDNIPGVILSTFNPIVEYSKKTTLSRVRVAGYEFVGWYDLDGNEVKEVATDAILYGKLIRKDFYNYWEKEEKTIKKVYDPNYKKVDPA